MTENNPRPKNKFLYYFIKFTLLDEIIGFIYWALVILGLFYVVGRNYGPALTIVLCSSVVLASVAFYFYIIKRAQRFFKSEKRSP